MRTLQLQRNVHLRSLYWIEPGHKTNEKTQWFQQSSIQEFLEDFLEQIDTARDLVGLSKNGCS